MMAVGIRENRNALTMDERYDGYPADYAQDRSEERSRRYTHGIRFRQGIPEIVLHDRTGHGKGGTGDYGAYGPRDPHVPDVIIPILVGYVAGQVIEEHLHRMGDGDLVNPETQRQEEGHGRYGHEQDGEQQFPVVRSPVVLTQDV